MKTPHRIELLTGGEETFNPLTGEYETVSGESRVVPCLVNAISQAKSFEEYGDRTQKIIICRFLQEQKPFTHARYLGETYEPIEAIDAPIKGAIRLRRVVR